MIKFPCGESFQNTIRHIYVSESELDWSEYVGSERLEGVCENASAQKKAGRITSLELEEKKKEAKA